MNDVVAVEVLNKLRDSITKRIDDGLTLARTRDEPDHFLQSTSSMLV